MHIRLRTETVFVLIDLLFVVNKPLNLLPKPKCVASTVPLVGDRVKLVLHIALIVQSKPLLFTYEVTAGDHTLASRPLRLIPYEIFLVVEGRVDGLTHIRPVIIAAVLPFFPLRPA